MFSIPSSFREFIGGFDELSLVGLGVPEELVLEEGLGCGPVFLVSDEALPDEVCVRGRPLLLVDGRHVLVEDLGEYLRLIFAHVGWIHLGQLVGHDAERPDVDRGRVLLIAPDQLGGHPVQSPALRLPFRFLRGELNRESEVAELHIAL